MKKSIIIPILLLTLTISLSGCDLWEDIKWTLGLVNYGRIEGTVTDMEGNPMSGMDIGLHNGTRADSWQVTAITDDDGYFQFDEVRYSEQFYWVKFYNEDYEIRKGENSSIIITEGKTILTNITNVGRIDNYYLDIGCSSGSGDEDYISAQSFKPTVSTIRKVQTEDSITKVEIRTDNAGEPGDTILASDSTLTGDMIDYYLEAIFDSPVNVTIGNTYWILLYGNGYRASEDKYTDGVGLCSTDGGNTWETTYAGYTIYDNPFATYY